MPIDVFTEDEKLEAQLRRAKPSQSLDVKASSK